MDGRGRWIDNRMIERLWRSVKYEDVYLNDYDDGLSAGRGLRLFFDRYNNFRPHQKLDDATPGDWYHQPQEFDGQPATWDAMRPSAAEPKREKTRKHSSNDGLQDGEF